MFSLIDTRPYSLHALIAENNRPKPNNVIDLAVYRRRHKFVSVPAETEKKSPKKKLSSP